MAKQKNKQQALLKGWSVIAKFLGLPPTSAQRWAKEGMPIRREGRFTVADPGELQAWLGRESHMKAPARVMIGDTEIAAALKDSLSVARNEKKRDQDMGGRYRLSATERCLSQYFNLDPKDVAWAARWNIAPTQEVATSARIARSPGVFLPGCAGASSPTPSSALTRSIP